MKKWQLAGIVAALSTVSGCGGKQAGTPADAVVPPPASAAPTSTIKPVVSFNKLMVMFVDQAADPIWNAALKPPRTDKGWEQIEYHAIQLATTGTLLQVGGTGPMDMKWTNSPGWVPFTQQMSQVALAAAEAARNRNVQALQDAGDQLVLNCEACHRQFKPDLPTEGLPTHLSRGIITAPVQ